MRLQLRSLISQLCGVFPYNCLQFALGSVMGFQIILIAELYKTDSEIPTTLEQLSWFASLDIIKLVGSLITGLLAHRLGSRTLSIVAALTYIISCLLYYFSTTVTTIFVGRTITSFLMLRSLCIPYISEISEPRLRGRLLATAQLCQSVGSFFSLLLGALVYWRTIALVNLVVPVLVAVTILATPNSPTWLASKGRFDEAEQALCWVRGWVPPSQVQQEFRLLVESAEKSNSTPRKSKPQSETTCCQEHSRTFLQPFLQRSFCLPLITMCALFLVYTLCGAGVTESYATVIFHEMNSPIEQSLATAILGAMVIVGNAIVTLVIPRVGKRRLILSCVVVAALCRASIALVGFAKLQGEFLWIPPIAMIVSLVANHAGIESTVSMVNSEIYPSQFRYIGTSIGFSLHMILASAMNKSFLYAVGAITLSGTFLVFALMNVVALVAYYLLVPETEGKSLTDIEDRYRSGKGIDERDML